MILNERYLRSNLKSELEAHKYKILLELRNYNKDEEYDLFISHSYMDKELVEVLYRMFEKAGYKVYIDWKQDNMQDRENVSAETARKIKNSMNNCIGLSYISSSNSAKSKWCPWELGYADGLKGKALILPVTKEKVNEYKGLEYLGIYPYIDYRPNSEGKYDFYVNDNINNSYISLRKWLKKGGKNE